MEYDNVYANYKYDPDAPVATGSFNAFYTAISTKHGTVGFRIAHNSMSSVKANDELKQVQKFAQLNVCPRVYGVGVHQGRPWQAVELFDGDLSQLLGKGASKACTDDAKLVDEVEKQLFELFQVLAANNFICFDVKAQNTVYKLIDEEPRIVVKLIDMDDSSCFSKVDTRYGLSKNDILFAQMVAFNNNTSEPYGECLGRPFFAKHLQQSAHQIHIARVYKLLSQQEALNYLAHYGQPFQKVSKWPADPENAFANDIVRKALSKKPLIIRVRKHDPVLAGGSVVLSKQVLSKQVLSKQVLRNKMSHKQNTKARQPGKASGQSSKRRSSKRQSSKRASRRHQQQHSRLHAAHKKTKASLRSKYLSTS
jgi:hypothetical protein